MAAQATFINALLDAGFRGQTYTGGTIKMGLFYTALPSAGGTEVSGGSYARQTITFNAAASKSISATSQVTFSNLPTTSTIVAYGIYSGTTLIDEKTFTQPFTPDVSNNQLKVDYSFSGS